MKLKTNRRKVDKIPITQNLNNLNILKKELANAEPLEKEEERELIRLYQDEGDIGAKQKVIESNLRFVYGVALSYNKTQKIDIRELINEGVYGLSVAIDRFDLTKSYVDSKSGETRFMKFYSYGAQYIFKYIIEYVTDFDIVKRGRYTHKIRREINESIDKFYNQNERIPMPHEIEEDVNIKGSKKSNSKRVNKHFEEVMNDAQNPLNFDTFFSENETLTGFTSQSKDEESTVWNTISEMELDNDDLQILKYSYGFEGSHELSLEDTAERMAMTQEEVSSRLTELHELIKSELN